MLWMLVDSYRDSATTAANSLQTVLTVQTVTAAGFGSVGSSSSHF
jgi:hypothetical protein